VGLGDVDYVLYQLGDVGVAFDRYRDDAAAAGGYFLDVAEGLFVLEDARWVGGVLGGDADYGEGFVDEGVGPYVILPAEIAGSN